MIPFKIRTFENYIGTGKYFHSREMNGMGVSKYLNWFAKIVMIEKLQLKNPKDTSGNFLQTYVEGKEYVKRSFQSNECFYQKTKEKRWRLNVWNQSSSPIL